MRLNTFKKMVQGEPISLTSDSLMNFILYEDVLEIINSKRRGIISISANGSITLRNVAKIIGKKITFGNFYFKTSINKDGLKTKYSSEKNIKKYLYDHERKN